jgi:hypothetical protein
MHTPTVTREDVHIKAIYAARENWEQHMSDDPPDRR